MADESWQKAREIFDSALRRHPDERDEFVKSACGSDESLYTEVISLLSSRDSADSFLETLVAVDVGGSFVANGNKLEEGQCIGHYEIVEQLGTGGMGVVYLAKDQKLGRRVAIKILNEKFSNDESNLNRFIREAKAASALNHPNILVIHEIGEAEGSHFIVSEFIQGKTLRDIFKEKALSLYEILDVSVQIAGALDAAHEAHLIHRDIKPENIMVRPDGYAKILDFGLAKLIEQKNRSVLGLEESAALQNQTAKGVILGTVNYMSPEQARGLDVDERTDIFSLGVVIYEMIAGKTPFAGDSVSETFANLITAEPLPLSRFSSNVPDELERIVIRMLSKNKDERFQTMKDLLADLRNLHENLTFDEKLERSPTARVKTTGVLHPTTGDANIQNAETQNSFSLQVKRHRSLSAIALAVLLIAATGFGFWFFAYRTKQIESIAVLPFQNASGDANLDYLSDGLSESIIDRLSGLPQLKVIARNSSFKFRGQDDWQQAAKALGVRAIITGRVTLNGDTLAIRVELVDVQENRQLWSQQYNRKVTDASVVQQEITQMISEKLSLKLSGDQEQQLAQRKTVDPQAFDLELKGRFHAFKGGAENWKKAVEYYQQAIAIAPDYAPAYTGLFWAYRNLFTRGVLDPKEFVPKAVNAAQKALELDPDLAEAHLALAYTKKDGWHWQEAEASYKRALELKPNLAAAHGAYSAYLSVLGRHDEAIAEARRAGDLDPFSPFFKMNTAFVLFLARRYDEAIEDLKKTLELDRNNSNAHLILGLAYTEKGMYPEAIAAHQEAIKVDKISPSLQISLGTAYARAGEREQAEMLLRQLRESGSLISSADLAIFHTALGEREQAFASLEQAYAAHDIQLQYLRVAPAYDPLRDEPRFDELVRRIQLK